MTPTSPSLNYTPCHVRHVVWALHDAPCDRCGQPAPRFSTATRTAVDLDLDQPVLLLVTVSLSFAQIGSQFESVATTTYSIYSGYATTCRKCHWLS